jgi:hypothetical protein
MTRHRRLLLPTAPTRAAARKGSAPFYAYLPAAPTTSDRAAARRHFDAITDLLAVYDELAASGSFPPLSHQHRTNLQRLAHRWRRRAAGDDARWNLAGTRPGRLPKELEIKREPHPLWRKDKP